ncbi:hypothetical protein BC835DRAFT_1414534 [Cytidiella melzeri]|nr:hypothetical protein BC835DRAFT_1414534 [Cytidiella melzeri]
MALDRTGFLFDAFAVSGTARPSGSRNSSSTATSILSQALVSLREVISAFQPVVLTYVVACDDHFFINRPLFLKRFPVHHEHNRAGQPSDWVRFVSLAETNPTVTLLPQGVNTLLNTLTALCTMYNTPTCPPLLVLDVAHHKIPAMDLIPFTALLLEYPVAYVPDTASSMSSGEIQAAVGTSAHTFMQFSCPRSLTEETGDLTSRLRERFVTRINDAGLQCELLVTSRTERLDRVAL